MKTLLTISAVCLLLAAAGPSFAQVSWGVDLRFGTPPPPPEVIVERPYPDAVWEPGYYGYDAGYRHVWCPGRWHPHYWAPQGHHYGWYRGDWDRDRGYEHGRGFERDRDHDHDRGEGRRDRGDEGRGRGGEHRGGGRAW